MKLFLSQIQDIDKMPYYLNRLGELNIEDNNVILNYQLSGNTSNKGIGGGLTIQDGDALGSDVTFRIGSLNTLTDSDLNISEYTNGSGYTNLGFVTELNDIVLQNSSTSSMDGLRVIKEKDIINGGTLSGETAYSGSNRYLKFLVKSSEQTGVTPSVSDLLPGELMLNIADGKLFTLKGGSGNYEVIEIGSSISNNPSSGTTSGTTSTGTTSGTTSGATSGATSIQNLTWVSPYGTGNEERYPAYGLYDYSHSMFIIRASEIGSGSKLLHGLQIEMAGYNGGYTYTNQTIKLAHTSDLEFGDNVKVDLTNINNITNLTTVKDNFNWTVGASGFQTIDFDTNFEYNGSDSLLIIWENRDGNWNSGFGWAECWFDNTYVDSWFKYQDNSYPSGYGTKDLSYRPNFKLNY
jgi:hypothetical protein